MAVDLWLPAVLIKSVSSRDWLALPWWYLAVCIFKSLCSFISASGFYIFWESQSPPSMPLVWFDWSYPLMAGPGSQPPPPVVWSSVPRDLSVQTVSMTAWLFDIPEL
ncbi:hypothetical protein F2Q68_00028128 [Brassica cretica]|uniref:Uncharacterized protein n=1 Tax=Brassica cretica TaxID=69181 RepID=A0A8S9ICP5_BRACR|nr:hypothetical protein F2Q68_00028128 [Brassica cretica]